MTQPDNGFAKQNYIDDLQNTVGLRYEYTIYNNIIGLSVQHCQYNYDSVVLSLFYILVCLYYLPASSSVLVVCQVPSLSVRQDFLVSALRPPPQIVNFSLLCRYLSAPARSGSSQC